MRDVFYEPEEIAEAYHAWAPRLRDYAAACRRQDPLPDRSSLSAAHAAQFRILCDALAGFRDEPIRMPPPYLMIYHGSPLTLLAASEVFKPCPESIVMLLSEERERWFRDVFRGPDLWYGTSWMTMHETVPQWMPDGASPVADVERWMLTKARGGWASHERWLWDGKTTAPTGVFYKERTEEGFIDELPRMDEFPSWKKEFLWPLE